MDIKNIKDIKDINTTTLAYMGDAVYEVYVRRHVLSNKPVNSDALHKKSIRYVRAEAQAFVIKKMISELSEEEAALVKRARNHKISSKPKNADPVVYKWATAFEALIGYHYLTDNKCRCDEIMDRAVRIVEKEMESNGREKRETPKESKE